jgi:DNA-binding response OmpR family regulator
MRVLIADGDEYGEIIAEALRRDGHEVRTASTAAGAQRAVAQLAPDLVVLDAELPDGPGCVLARELRAARPGLGIVFVSRLERECDVLAGFAAGADDYVAKPFHPAVLVARVRALARRAGLDCAAAGALRGCGLEFDRERKTAYFDGCDLRCTPIEFAILTEMAALPGQALPHAFINTRVWQYPNLDDGTLLKGHVSAIRRKLREAGAGEALLRTVPGVGYALTAS